jgi:hypothetical protein
MSKTLILVVGAKKGEVHDAAEVLKLRDTLFRVDHPS